MKFLPEFACDVELSVRAEVTGGDFTRILDNSRKLTIPFDETADFHGLGLHWSADELFLGSVLASLSNTFLYFVRKRKGQFIFSKLELMGEIHVCYQDEEHIYRIKDLAITGTLEVPYSQYYQARKLWDLTAKTCHIIQSINNQIEININMQISPLKE